MTVTSTATALVYRGNGLTTQFPTPYFTADADLVVVYRNSAGGLVNLVLGTDFTAAGAGQPGGGTVTILTPAYVPNFDSDGSRLVVDTAIAATQEVDLPEGGPFPSGDVEGAIDRLTRLVQQLQGQVARALRAPVADLAGDMALPTEAQRALKVLYFDASGAPSPLTVAQLALLPQTFPKQPARYAADAGMRGDGAADDAPALQKDMDAMSALAGGAVYFLRATDGYGFYLGGRLRVPSNVSLVWLSPVWLAPKAGVSVRGGLATVSGKDSFRLLSDATAGGTTLNVDTAPHGGLNLSSYFSVGDVVWVRGLLDSCGTPLEEQVVRVTAIDDANKNLAVADQLAYGFQATYADGAYAAAWGATNQARIALVRGATLASDAAEGGNVLVATGGSVVNLQVGDWLLVEDEKRQSDIGGAGTGLVHREIARVVAIGEGGAGNVRLHRRLSRAYQASFHGRVLALQPAAGASVQGAVAEFRAVADSSPWPTFEAKWAVASQIAQCRVPNADQYGSRGNGVRVDQCFGVNVLECSVEEPKYLAAGEGYGVYVTHSTRCEVRDSYARGCRHSFIFYNATACDTWDCESEDCRLSDFDMHGGDEYGCTHYNPEVTGGSVSASTTLCAFAFGNSSGLGGSRSCGVQGGKVERYSSALSYCVRFEPLASKCFVRGTRFRDIYQLVHHADIAGYPTLVASENSLEGVTVDGCADFLVYLKGNENGSANRTCQTMRVVGLVARNVGRLFYAQQCGGVAFVGCDVDAVTPDASYTYAFTCLDVTGLRIEENKVNGASRGVQVTTCPNYICQKNEFTNLVNGTVLDAEGGNAGGEWRDNGWSGFDPTAGRQATDIMVEAPRLAGSVTLADDTVFVTKPPRPVGVATLVGNGAVPWIRFLYKTGTSPAAPVSMNADGSTAFQLGTGALTNGTSDGTDNKFNLSTHTDGYIYVKNRLGSSQGPLDIIWS